QLPKSAHAARRRAARNYYSRRYRRPAPRHPAAPPLFRAPARALCRMEVVVFRLAAAELLLRQGRAPRADGPAPRLWEPAPFLSGTLAARALRRAIVSPCGAILPRLEKRARGRRCGALVDRAHRVLSHEPTPDGLLPALYDVTGSCGPPFCGGRDRNEMAARTPLGMRPIYRRTHRCLLRVFALRARRLGGFHTGHDL